MVPTILKDMLTNSNYKFITTNTTTHLEGPQKFATIIKAFD